MNLKFLHAYQEKQNVSYIFSFLMFIFHSELGVTFCPSGRLPALGGRYLKHPRKAGLWLAL